MRIKVIYQGGKIGVTESDQLDFLISSNKIKKFQRAGKWVTIGVDPIRQIKEDYLEVPVRKKSARKPEKKK